MPRWYLGIDGGQSSTTALICDETGRIRGHGRGGPCNHARTGEGRTKFFNAVTSCLEEGCCEAGLDPTTVSFASVCLGFSGGPKDKEAYSRELIRSERYKVTHDAEIALCGATAAEPGIVVIAGTGSMAYGRNAEGKSARAGGWGYIFGDEGSAFDITRHALRAALQYEEGWGASTSLRRVLLDATGATNADDLLHRFYTTEYPRPAIAALAPLISRAAEEGDATADRIVREAGEKLAWFAESVYRSLFQTGVKAPVAYTGRVFRSDLLRNSFIARVRESIGCRAAPPRLSPVAGAVLEALRLDGNQSELSDVPAADSD